MTAPERRPELLDSLSEAEHEHLVPEVEPEWMAPMLATLTDKTFSNSDWLFERKFDGIRCLAWCRGGDVNLYSRNRQSLDATYPELVEALAGQRDERCVVDGEVVAFRGRQTSFARLQGRMGLTDPAAARASGIAVYYYLFDLLYFNGYRLTRLPLRARKNLLRRTLKFRDPLRYAQHRNAAGEACHRAACRKGWEGVIAKRANGRYVHKRSTDWLKFKCVNQQEFVIGGFTDPQGARTGFGALLLGYYDRNDLRYAGRVGTGFDARRLRDLHRELAGRERKTTAFANGEPRRRGVHWVRPELIAEVAFTEWTDDGRLRHPRFLGLRNDKLPQDVTRETTS